MQSLQNTYNNPAAISSPARAIDANSFSVPSSDENSIINDSNNNGDNEAVRSPKPSQTVIPCARNIKRAAVSFSTVIADSEFNSATTRDCQNKILKKFINSDKKLVNYLRAKKF